MAWTTRERPTTPSCTHGLSWILVSGLTITSTGDVDTPMDLHATFATKLAELRGDPSSPPVSDTAPGDRVRLAELRAMFQAFLPDFTTDELQAVADIQHELRTQQTRLEGLLEARVIDETEFSKAVSNEADWCFRRCSQILGPDRFESLFGVDVAGAIRVPGEPSATALIERYEPAKAERKHVVSVSRKINPQQLRRITGLPWPARPWYGHLLRSITRAEQAYEHGEVNESIALAHAVIEDATHHPTLSDTALYLAAWAYHIKGRGYQALMHWQSAADQYEASLALKARLGEWLPPGFAYATEIKLRSVEIAHSPVQVVTKMNRMIRALRSNSGLSRGNLAFYQNLLEDSLLVLAEGYLGLGNQALAARSAHDALRLAKVLHDIVGEMRILSILCRTSASDQEINRKRLHLLLRRYRQQRTHTHPQVARIIALTEGTTTLPGDR